MAEGSKLITGVPEVLTSTGDVVVPDDAQTRSEGAVVPARSGRLARWGQRGMVSAEWAVGLIAAIAIAGVLVAIVTNGRVERAILGFILMVIQAFSTHLGSV